MNKMSLNPGFPAVCRDYFTGVHDQFTNPVTALYKPRACSWQQFTNVVLQKKVQQAEDYKEFHVSTKHFNFFLAVNRQPSNSRVTAPDTSC